MTTQSFLLSLAFICALASQARGHGDPLIVTLTQEDVTTNGNVFSSEFEGIAGLTYTDVPGLEFHGFENGDVVSFDIVDHLWYWNSADGVSAAPDELEFRIESKASPFPVVAVKNNPDHLDGQNEFIPGFSIETIDAFSNQHQDLLAYLFETQVVPAGAYGIVVRLKSEGYETAPPILIAFNQDIGGIEFRDGIQELREAAFFEPIDPYPTGDFNLDRIVDATDIDLLYAHRGSDEIATYDLTTDGIIDNADAVLWVEVIVGTRFGDSDLNRAIDIADLNAVRNQFGAAGGWAAGDSDGSGVVDVGDLNHVRNGFGFAGAASVPEPSALALSGLAVAILTPVYGAARRRAKCYRECIKRCPIFHRRQA